MWPTPTPHPGPLLPPELLGGPPPRRPRRSRRALIAAAVVTVVVLVGAGLAVALTRGGDTDTTAPSPTRSGSTTSATATTSTSETGTPGDGSALPQVGECYHYSRVDLGLDATASPVVPCEASNAQTVYVGSTPSITPIAVARRAQRFCPAAEARALGVPIKDVGASLITFLYYVPDHAAALAGAHWFRCDVAAEADGHLLPLPADLREVFRGDSPARPYRACLDQRRERSACDARSGFTYAGSFDVDARVRPPNAQLLHLARHRCPLPKGAQFLATFPGTNLWTYGHERYVACWLVRNQ